MKKECEFFQDKLLEYSLGELDAEPELKKKIEEHIGICTDCWKKVDDYKRTSAAAAEAMKVELSGDAWELARKEIIKRVTYKPDVMAAVRKFLHSLLTTRKLATGFALLVFLAAGTAAGVNYYNYSKQIRAERAMITKVDMLENIDLIERLDFYKKFSEKKALL